MRYTVKDLLESGQFPEMKLISGESELNREIKGARLLEVANMECFLSGDEILFTSLKAYENVDLQEFVKHLEGLKKKQISAFIVKRDQQTELQRIRFNILLQYAKSQQIPVIEIPKTLYYWGIIKHILTHIYDMETAKLTYFKTTHDSLEGRGGGTTYLVDEKDSVEKIFALIYSMLENPVALYDEEYECLHSNDPTLSEFTMKEDAEVFVPNIITKYQYWHQKREQSEYIHKIDVFGYRTFYLVVTEQNKKMETLDFIALENIVVVLRHIIMRSLMEKNIAKYYHKDIAYRLLNGTLTELEKEEAAKMLPETVRLVVMDTDDAWARDTGPTFVVSGNVDTPYEARDLRGINWEFNAWGGTYDGLYAYWDNDNLVAGQFMSYLGCQGYNAAPFVLEGGSIHTDGEGTLLVTENCLLSKGRNPGLSKSQIEEKLKMYCNVHKIICLTIIASLIVSLICIRNSTGCPGCQPILSFCSYALRISRIPSIIFTR